MGCGLWVMGYEERQHTDAKYIRQRVASDPWELGTKSPWFPLVTSYVIPGVRRGFAPSVFLTYGSAPKCVSYLRVTPIHILTKNLPISLQRTSSCEEKPTAVLGSSPPTRRGDLQTPTPHLPNSSRNGGHPRPHKRGEAKRSERMAAFGRRRRMSIGGAHVDDDPSPQKRSDDRQ